MSSNKNDTNEKTYKTNRENDRRVNDRRVNGILGGVKDAQLEYELEMHQRTTNKATDNEVYVYNDMTGRFSRSSDNEESTYGNNTVTRFNNASEDSPKVFKGLDINKVGSSTDTLNNHDYKRHDTDDTDDEQHKKIVNIIRTYNESKNNTRNLENKVNKKYNIDDRQINITEQNRGEKKARDRRSICKEVESGGRIISGSSDSKYKLSDIKNKEVKLKGAKRDAVRTYNIKTGATVKQTAINLVLGASGETGEGIRKVMTTWGVVKAIPVAVITNGATRARRNDYKNYLMNRNNKEYLKKRQSYMKQIQEIKSGKRTYVDKELRPTALEKAINKNDFKAIKTLELRRINKILKDAGINTVPTNAKNITMIARSTWRRLKKDNHYIPQEVKKALKDLEKLGKNAKYLTKPKFNANILRRLASVSRQYIAKDDAGRGIIFALDMSKNITKLIRKQLSTFRHGARIARNITRRAAIGLLKKQIKKLEQLKNKKILSNKPESFNKKIDTLQTKVDRKISKNDKKNNKRKRKQERKDIKHERKLSRRGQLKRNIKQKLKNTRLGKAWDNTVGKFFKKKISPFISRIKNSKAYKFGGKFGGFIKNSIGKVFKFLDLLFKPIAIIKSIINYIIGAFVSMVGLWVIISIILTIILSILDFANVDKKVILTKALQDFYLDDLRYICQEYTGSQYVLGFEDVRDNESYLLNGMEDEDSDIWYQSSNIAEICSMTYVNFEMDFDIYDTTDICNYAKELYYGSHEIVGKDYGNKGEIYLKTYYFDSLFSRGPEKPQKWVYVCDDGSDEERDHSPDLVQKGVAMGALSDAERGACEALLNQGYSREMTAAIMGNIKAESNFNVNAIEGASGNAQGLFQFDPKGDLIGYLNWLKGKGETDSLENQVEYMSIAYAKKLSYTSGVKQRFNNSASHNNHTIYTSKKYTIDEIKGLDKSHSFCNDILDDYIKYGECYAYSGSLRLGGPKLSATEVKDYLNSLNPSEYAVAYGTILFTKTYELPATADWFTKRVIPAVEYYRKMGNFSGTIIAYDQAYYEQYGDIEFKGTWEYADGSFNYDWCGVTSQAVILATMGVTYDGHLIDPLDITEINEKKYGHGVHAYGNIFGPLDEYLQDYGAINCNAGDPGGSGLKYKYKNGSYTVEQIKDELSKGHLVMLQESKKIGDIGLTLSGGKGNHWFVAYGIDNDKVLIANVGQSALRFGGDQVWGDASSILDAQQRPEFKSTISTIKGVHSRLCRQLTISVDDLKETVTCGYPRGAAGPGCLIMWRD